jgi:hypothetical protein
MDPILGEVQDVVDEIDGPGQDAKDPEGRERPQEERNVANFERKEQRGENEEIFRPLRRPQGPENVEDHRGPFTTKVGAILHYLSPQE